MRQPRYPTVDQAPTNRELREAVQTAAGALTASDVGSAAYAESADFATAAQGSEADSAVQSVTGSAVNNTDPRNPVINITGGGGASGPWVLMGQWDGSVDAATNAFDVGGLDDFSEAYVVLDNVATSVSTWRYLNLSTDGGATFLSGYTIDGNGVASSGLPPLHSTANSGGRYCGARVPILSSPGGSILVVYPARGTPGAMFRGATGPVNLIRVIPGSGNFTGGTIQVWAR